VTINRQLTRHGRAQQPADNPVRNVRVPGLFVRQVRLKLSIRPSSRAIVACGPPIRAVRARARRRCLLRHRQRDRMHGRHRRGDRNYTYKYTRDRSSRPD
jgi:hypothetical protein